MTDKADVFLDGMFLQMVLDSFGLEGKVDYEKFTNKLAKVENSERQRTYYFDALPYVAPSLDMASSSANQKNKQKFLDKLSYLDSFQVELGYVKLEEKTCPSCKNAVKIPRQKKVDILLATRLIERSLEVDKIVLVAGDADFTPAIEVAKKKAKIVLAFAPSSTSTQLKQKSDRKIELSKAFFNDCLRA